MAPLFRSKVPLFSAVRYLGLAASFLLAWALPAAAQTITGTSPVKIFILAGESNMHGKGRISSVTTRGSLDYIVANDPEGKYQFLKSGGSYVVRDDVGIRGLVFSSAANPGNLTVGYGGFADGYIGPELGFGHLIGDAFENKVLIVKVGVDATTLAGSFCPPSSRVGEPEPVTSADKGFYYKEILRLVNEAKASISGTYEVAGFGWHQGWNDRSVDVMSAAYETNMANFINDIRSSDKGLGVPNLPFVIATAGMDGNPGVGYSEVEKAQLKMADPVAYPAFVGNVAVVDTRAPYDGLEFWQLASQSPMAEGYHWNRSGKSYLHIGLATGDAMSLLAPPGRIPFRPRGSGDPGGVTLTWKNGTEIPSSVRVLRNGVEIAAAAPVNPPTFLDASAPLGVNNYELQFTMPGDPCPPLTLSHNGGITGLKGHQRANGIKLTWSNNRTYTGITVKRNGTVIAASLLPAATSYTDLSPPSGSVNYSVEPTDGGSTPAQVQVAVSAAPSGGAVIYEPFDMTAGTALSDKDGGIGLDGNWLSNDTLEVAAGSLSFGTLPTFGNSIARTSGNGNCSIQIGTTLTDAGLMADGAELWFSFLYREPNNTNYKTAFILGNDLLMGEAEISYMGSGIGLRVGNGRNPIPMVFNASIKSEGSSQTTLTASQTALIVGKITWGATPGALDTIQIYTPGTDLVLDTPTSRTAVLDQSNFNVISMFGNGSAPKVDEIRFGATYQDVIGQGIDTSGDNIPPAPATMSFAISPNATSASTITMTATAASDANGVQYQFLETSGNLGGTSSDWQDSPVHTDTGLSPNTQYIYTVRARDKSVNLNMNTISSPGSATTLAPDTNPPPTPGFASGPVAMSSSAITMTATVVTDPEGGGVEYFFDETSGNPGGTDSSWQSSTTYIDSGLSASTQYSYTVKARDTASPPNESAVSSAASATTLAVSGPGAAVICEPFDQAVGSALGGQAGGTGLGNWTLKDGTDNVIKSGSVSYGSLPVSGNRYEGAPRYNNNAYPTLSAAGLMSHGASLWFSAVIQPLTTSNTRFVLALATADIDTGAWTVGTTGQCIGINLQNGQDLQITTASAGTISRNTAKDNLSTTAPTLVVGEIIWGADGTAADTIKLYLPATGLAKPAVLDTSTVVVNQAAFDALVIGYGGSGSTKLDEIRFGASYESVIGQGSSGPGPLDHFAISAISSPQTVGMPITGITLTAQDAANQTVTSFTGTVTFGGTGGFTGTSANFAAGVLTGVSATPTTAGSNLTFTATDSVSGKTGSTVISTIQTQYETWSGGALFDEDANGDGVDNGMAFLLGAKTKDENASHLLPAVSQTGGALKLTFKCLNAAMRGTAVLKVLHSWDLGITDLWTNHDAAVVPGVAPATTTVGGVDFVTSVFDANLNNVEATIPASAAAPGTSLFARLKAIYSPP